MFGDNNSFIPQAQPQGFVQQGWASSNKRALLYVFRPRLFTQQVRRPHTYNFDTGFKDDVQEAIFTQARTGLTNHNKLSYMAGSRLAQEAILPSATGLDIQCQRLSDFWTFVLIIDNDSPEVNGRRLSLNNRLVYWGICNGEPINPKALWGGVTVNPNCILEITHQTNLSIETQQDAMGFRQHASPVVDNDIVRPNMVGTLSPGSEHLLTPNVVFDSVIPQGGGNFINTTVGSQLNLQEVIPVDSLLNSPKEHLKTVVQATLSAAKEMTMSDAEIAPAFRDNSSFIQVDPESNRDRFRNHINYTAPDPVIGVDARAPISIAELQARYANLDVQEVPMEHELPIDVASQLDATPTNIFGSIINSALPAMMSNVGLSEVAFRYASRAAQAFVRDSEPVVEVQEVKPYIPEDMDATKRRWWHLYDRLQQHIFPMILHNMGHFDLTVQCQITGACVVQLQLLDQGLYAQGFLVNNQILGGAAMPVIGTHNNLIHNGSMLNQMVGAVLDGNAL